MIVEYLEYLVKIAYYFFMIFVIFLIAKKHAKKKDKFPVGEMIIVCGLFGYYSIICGKYPYVSDRLNFAFRFESDYYNDFVFKESFGLFLLERILHVFTYEPKVLFFVVAFLFMFFSLMAYKKSENTNPYTLLLLLVSAYPTYGLYMLKQSLSVAIMFLAFCYYNKSKILSLFFVISAILFHEAALIVVPILLIKKLLKNDVLRKIMYLGFIAVVVGFAQYNGIIINFVTQIVPTLGYQLNQYINTQDGAIISNGTYMTFLKGIPFFTIYIAGLLYKKEGMIKIKEYNIYMFLTFFTSVTFLLSNYMYWLFRFGLYFYFPVFIFAIKLMEIIKNKQQRLIYCILTYGLLFFLTMRLWCQYYFIYGGI